MITEDYVSFEVAKLLKEKGFDEYCFAAYSTVIGDFITVGPIKNSEIDANKNVTESMEPGDFGNLYANCDDTHICTAPTHQMAMKWLREVPNMYIEVCADKSHNFQDIIFRPAVYDRELDCLWESDNFSTYEEACEAALKYCLTKLI